MASAVLTDVSAQPVQNFSESFFFNPPTDLRFYSKEFHVRIRFGIFHKKKKNIDLFI